MLINEKYNSFAFKEYFNNVDILNNQKILTSEDKKTH